MKTRRAAVWLAWLFAIGGPPAARAQTLPSDPIVFADGRVTIGGDVSASFGSADPGFFNYTDYEHSALRLLRVDLSGAVNAGDHFALLAQLRTENFDSVRPYAFYVRIRPWTARRFDIQAGRVPPTFGAFSRRTYANDNPLIGYPLAYQYLTSLRPDALPANRDELLRRRGLGWLTRYSIGNPVADRGMPLVSAFRWDTGVQLHAETDQIRATVAVTSGSVSHPVFKDDNSGKQIAGRLEVRPATGLILGGSAARGPFVTRSAARDAVGDGHDREFTQTAWGADAEYSRNYYLVRFESIVSAWRLPVVRTPALDSPVRAVSTSIEGRYKIVPGLYAAARFDHIGFSDLAGTQATLPWDAPVTRLELGGGYSIQRNLLLKLSYQRNTRDGGPLARVGHLQAIELVFWF